MNQKEEFNKVKKLIKEYYDKLDEDEVFKLLSILEDKEETGTNVGEV